MLLVLAHPVRRLLADRNQPLLVAFADAGEVLLVESQVGGSNADELRHAHAGCVEELDHRAVSQTERRRDVGLRDERVHLFQLEEPWQSWPGLRRMEIVGRVVREPAVEDEKAVKAPNGRDGPSDRSGREPGCSLSPHERFEGPAVERFDGLTFGGGECREAPQVARVAVERVIGEPALDAQMFQVSLDHAWLC